MDATDSRVVLPQPFRPRTTQREPTIWTPEEAAAFLEAADDWRPLFAFTLATGVRRGEALGLRWRDVDLDRQSVRIEQTVYVVRGGVLASIL